MRLSFEDIAVQEGWTPETQAVVLLRFIRDHAGEDFYDYLDNQVQEDRGIDPTQRTWTVSYTARRKVVEYQRQTVTVEVTEEQYRKLFGADPDRKPDDMEIEQLAVEHALIDDLGWVTSGEMQEALDEEDFEITNGKR